MTHARLRFLLTLIAATALIGTACSGGGDNGGALEELGIDEPPPICPLTGQEAPDETLLDRRVLAVKIENSPEARPQIGLAEADVIYEQEAEGGITRFNVLYHCQDADRIGPIRSARPVDPAILQQYGDPLFVHAGSVDAVIEDVEAAGIEDINCNFEPDVCPRDPSHTAPHDIFTSTDALREAGKPTGDPPGQVFVYDDAAPEGKRGKQIHLNYSGVANVYWKYRANQDAYLRFHDETPHDLEDGTQVTTTNVVVMVVERLDTRINDSAGNPVPNYELVGSGELYVFRNGKVIKGRWQREEESAATKLVDTKGEEIALASGQTWVELFPEDAPEPIDF